MNRRLPKRLRDLFFKARVKFALILLMTGARLINGGTALMPRQFRVAIPNTAPPIPRLTSPPLVGISHDNNGFAHRLHSPPALVALALIIAIILVAFSLSFRQAAEWSG